MTRRIVNIVIFAIAAVACVLAIIYAAMFDSDKINQYKAVGVLHDNNPELLSDLSATTPETLPAYVEKSQTVATELVSPPSALIFFTMSTYPLSTCWTSLISLVPSAMSAAVTSAAPALRSVAFTGAALSFSTPSKTATLPSTWILAPILLSSSQYLNLESHIPSVIMDVPSAMQSNTPITGCRSVGNPG